MKNINLNIVSSEKGCQVAVSFPNDTVNVHSHVITPHMSAEEAVKMKETIQSIYWLGREHALSHINNFVNNAITEQSKLRYPNLSSMI